MSEAAAKASGLAPGTQDSMAHALHGKAGLDTARAMLAERRNSGDKQLKPDGTPVEPQKEHADPSEAARILAQHANRARAQARQAKIDAEAQEAAGAAAQTTDNTPEGTDGLETDDQATLTDEADVQSEQSDDPDQAEIDLGEGVTLTRAEIRANLLRQADYTRKTQAAAEKDKAFQKDRSERLHVLDSLIQNFANTVGQPKSLKQWISEDPIDGLGKFADQQERVEQLNAAVQLRRQEQAHHMAQLKDSTVKALAEKHGDKAQTYFDTAVDYAHKRIGGDKAMLEAALSHPEAIAIMHDAKAYRDLQAKSGEVKRAVAGKPVVVKPGAKVSSQAQTQSALQAAVATLRTSGKPADAVRAFQLQRAARGQ
jgi:hypothetical protein